VEESASTALAKREKRETSVVIFIILLGRVEARRGTIVFG
jgi:hypothetical protein